MPHRSTAPSTLTPRLHVFAITVEQVPARGDLASTAASFARSIDTHPAHHALQTNRCGDAGRGAHDE
jgi:hypothetical protein